MPLTRYVIKNHLNSADPELYASVNKNDTDFVLEGVATAGLIALLRQLGDLAQFAAEVFHDLHQEVVATAGKGRGLIDRVKRLEADVPSIEKNLLSMTKHTPFYYIDGVDWHPQMLNEENVITRCQWGMNRFIRNCYEESRSPPQLFLLDKYDINGAGACMKRFTDPSFFKVRETISTEEKIDAQSNWRSRKVRKKGSYWKHGDTQVAQTTTRSKLHDLLVKDAVKSKAPKRLVSLKNRNLDNSSGKSYMQKFLLSMFPEDSVMDEIQIGHPTLILKSNHTGDSKSETLDIENVSVANRKLEFDSENRQGNGIICSYSDGNACATKRHMDALADVETEVAANNGYIPRKEPHLYSITKSVRKNQDSSTELVQNYRSQFFDSHSVEKSNTSDDGSDSFMQESSSSWLHDKRGTFMKHDEREPESYPSAEAYEDRDAHSSTLLPDVDAFGEYSDDFDHEIRHAKITHISDSVASSLGLNVDYVGQLSTKNGDQTNAYSLSMYPDTSHVGSDNLVRERNHTDAMSISLSDHQEVESQCSSSVSPRYLLYPKSRSEMDTVDEFRKPPEVSFTQFDQHSIHDFHGHVVSNQDPSRFYRRGHRSYELRNYSSPGLDASSFTCSSPEWLSRPDEDVPKNTKFYHGLISSPNEESAADFPSMDKSLKQENGEVIFQSDSTNHVFDFPPTEVETNQEEFISMPHEMGSDNFIAHGEVKMPHESQTNESVSHTSIHQPDMFPFHADSKLLEGDRIDVHSQHDIFTSEEAEKDFVSVHLKPAEDTVSPMREITKPLEDTNSKSIVPEVSMQSRVESLEELDSYRNTEHAAESTEEKIIKCIEEHDPTIMDGKFCNLEENTPELDQPFLSDGPNQEDEILAEKPAAKLHRPWVPLIKSAGSLDRSKSKKVMPRNWPQAPNVESEDATDGAKFTKETPRNRLETPNADGRDSILKVIRTKSFNLRPAPPPSPKPIIRAPTMSLKVSAILEKANRIRQATAGSDEEDNWSDG